MPLKGAVLDDVLGRLPIWSAIPMVARCFWVEGGGRRITVTYGPKYTVAIVYAPAGKDFICFEPICRRSPTPSIWRIPACIRSCRVSRPVRCGGRVSGWNVKGSKEAATTRMVHRRVEEKHEGKCRGCRVGGGRRAVRPPGMGERSARGSGAGCFAWRLFTRLRVAGQRACPTKTGFPGNYRPETTRHTVGSESLADQSSPPTALGRMCFELVRRRAERSGYWR